MCLQEMQLLRQTVFLSIIDFDVLSSNVPYVLICMPNMYRDTVLAGFFFQCISSFEIYFMLFHKYLKNKTLYFTSTSYVHVAIFKLGVHLRGQELVHPLLHGRNRSV